MTGSGLFSNMSQEILDHRESQPHHELNLLVSRPWRTSCKSAEKAEILIDQGEKGESPIR